MTLAYQLRAAKALIDTPEKWTQGCAARDSYGRSVSPLAHDAVCFCSWGALLRSGALSKDMPDLMRLLDDETKSNTSVITYNDTADTTHGDIMAVYDRAIKRADAVL